MGRLCRLASLAAVLVSSAAVADDNDFRIYRLGNPDPGEVNHVPDANANFRAFARELGAAISSVNLMPPETLGHAAFAVSAEIGVVSLDTSSFTFPSDRPNNGTLLLPSLHVRKGLPFSFELGGRGAWIDKSHMVALTGELKWALNEGFAFLPDVGIRGHVTRLLGTRDFQLTTAGADFGIGKQFAIGGMLTLTPYLGWDLVFVGASGSNVDFDPGRTQEAAVASRNAQFENTAVFEEVVLGENAHNRFYGGLRFISGVIQLGAEISVSNFGSIAAPNPENPAETIRRPLPSVTAFNATIGLDY